MSAEREHHRRGRSMVAFAVFATFLLIATAASATSDTTTPFNGNTTNPCNGDTVAFQGQEHVVNNNRVNPNGTLFMNSMDQVHGQGVGNPSALQYNVGKTTKMNGKFPPGPVIFRDRTKVNSNGPADNFFETFFFRFNQDGSIGNTSFESDCRG